MIKDLVNRIKTEIKCRLQGHDLSSWEVSGSGFEIHDLKVSVPNLHSMYCRRCTKVFGKVDIKVTIMGCEFK